jgi:signal transduction histidine kinase
VDVALILLTAGAGALREWSDPNHATKLVVAPVGVYIALQVLAGAALWWRRTRPYTVALVIAAVSLLAPATAVFAAPYAVTRYGTRRRAGGVVLGALLICWAAGAHVWAIADPYTGPLLIAASALLGLYIRARRNLIDELRERADRAERERDLLAERARAEERARLAAEMHDVVTHRVNLMVLQAGALQVSSPDAAVRQASIELRAAGVQALAELRDLVGVLRTGDALPPREPGPVLASAERSLTELVDESRAVGLDIDLREDGDAGAAAPTVRRALFRVVQESLTNVHKHAPGAATTVHVSYATHRVAVDVANVPPPGRTDTVLAEAGGGTGLSGLRRRVELLGGHLSAQPREDGGFVVSAWLPAFVRSA